MAYSPGYSGLLNAAMPRIGQYEASTGRRINKQVVQGLLQADLDKSKQFAMNENFRNRQLAQQADQFNQQMDVNKDAATAGGVGQLLQLPMAYGAAKGAGIIPQGFQLTSPSTWGGATAPTAAAATAQGAVAPAVAGATAQGGLLTGGTASTGAGTIAPSAAGTAGAVGAEAGLMSTAGSVALPAAAASYVGGRLGGKVADVLGTHEKTTRDVMSVGAGAAAGFVVGGPIGAGVGAAIGLISSLF